MEALTAIYELRSDLVSFLRNMRSDYVHLRDEIRVISETVQRIPYDNNATLVIRARVDDVMERLMWKMGYGNDWDKYHKKICKDNYEE